MKNKILSVLLLFTLLFSVFSVFASADDTDVLIEEIEKNLPDLDFGSLSGNRIMTIGAMEDLVDETCLYLYLYNPKKLNAKSGYMNLNCTFEGSSGKATKNYNTIAFSVIAKSNDGAFCKVRIDLSSISDRLQKYSTIHSYSWDKIVLKYSSLGAQKEETVLQEYNWKFDYSTGACNVTYDVKEVAELDVHHTYYRTPSATSSINTFDEIHTVYFSIPDEYTKYYSKLYSVASTYTKKKTNPVVVTTENLLENSSLESVLLAYRNFAMLSSDYSPRYGEDLDQNVYYEADTGYNVSNHNYALYYIKDRKFTNNVSFYFHTDNVIEKPEDLCVTEEEFFEYVDYIESNYSKFYNVELFESSETIPWSEKTINDTFDVMYYHDRIQGDLAALVGSYGWKTGLMFWFHRNNPTKLQELSEKYLVDVPKDIPDNSNLLLCDEQVIKDAKNLTNQEFSDKYLIYIDDVPDFKNYLNTHNNVVLYRYDIVEYYSDEVVIGHRGDIFEEYENDYRYALIQMYAYFGFRVIDVTFNDDGNFVSLAVNSHPQNFASDPGLEEDEPPITLKPGIGDYFPNIFGSGNGSSGDNLRSTILRVFITVIMVVVLVAVIIIGIKFVLGGFFSIVKNKKNE